MRSKSITPLALVIVLFTGAFATSLLGGRPETRGEATFVSRAPAAVRSREEAARLSVVTLPCWETAFAPQGPVAARWVRLTGKTCAAEAAEVQVRNVTNGFVATVFADGAGLTTDLIPLEVGLNDVVIALGTSERRLTLTR